MTFALIKISDILLVIVNYVINRVNVMLQKPSIVAFFRRGDTWDIESPQIFFKIQVLWCNQNYLKRNLRLAQKLANVWQISRNLDLVAHAPSFALF